MKKKNTARFLALFLGSIGIHRFYLGQYLKGVLSIIFSWTFIPTFIGIFDFIYFSFMSNDYFQVTYNDDLKLKCSTCNKQLLENNTSYWALSDNKGVCKECFKKLRNHSKETGKYEFESDEVEKILNGEIKNRPLPNSKSDIFYVPIEDEFENIELPQEIKSIKLNSLAQIKYIDSKGQKSERRITMLSINQTFDDYIIKSYCHEKQAHRAFKLSRIEQLTDMETGEIFENPSKFFIDRFEDSPIGLITKVFQNLEPEILILTFIARADGFLRVKERVIIKKYINEKNDFELDDKLLENEIRRTYCESKEFRNSLKIVAKKEIEKRELVMKLATEIVDSDKNPDPMEIGALKLIEKELKLKKASA